MLKLFLAVKGFVLKHRRMILLMMIYFTFFIVASTFMLIILTSPKGEVKVPALVGKKFTAVYNSIARSTLRAELKYEDVYDIEDGVILNQYPEPGVVVSKGDKVKLLISRNDLKIEVPTLVGSGLSIVKNKLNKLHAGERTVSLEIGIISYIPSDKTPDNFVVMQSPAAGEKVDPDTKVNLLVSSGAGHPDLVSSEIKMPLITGQAIDLALPLLMSKGLFVDQEIVSVDKKEQSGIIMSQSIPNDALVKKGDRAVLKVGFYSIVERLYNGYERVDYEIPKSQGEGYYEAVVHDDMGERVCYAARSTAEKGIHFVFARQGNSRVKIIKDKKQITVIAVKMTDF